MKKATLLLLTCMLPATLHATPLTDRAANALNASNLVPEGTVSPQRLSGDFDGDGEKDTVYFVKDRKSGRQGLCILRANANRCDVIGAGRKFHAAGDDFKWVEQWETIAAGEVDETTFKRDGDVLGTRRVLLQNTSIRLCSDESGCGIVTYHDGKYFWVQQAD